MPGCLIALAFLFYFIGVIVWLNQKKIGSDNKESVTSRRFDFSTGEPIKNTSKYPKNYEASAYTQSEADMEHPGSLLSAFQIGDRILVGHPVQGDLTVYVQGKVIFSELWQRARDTQSPWVPTGNEFVGLFLEMNLFLLGWQNRLYLLDENIILSDIEIQRDFAPHARKFAQSDQMAEVFFAYPPRMWRMVDIGKFTVRSLEGQGTRMQVGAIGRFIHASAEGQRALVLEDYEGGGQDSVWLGFSIDTIKDDRRIT